MNSVAISGRLVRNPNIYHQAENAVCNFTIALNEYVNGKQRTDYINCVVWGRAAENLAKYQERGDYIEIEGTFINTSRKNEDGTKTYQPKVLCRTIKYTAKKNKNIPNGNKEMSANELEISQESQDFNLGDFSMEL